MSFYYIFLSCHVALPCPGVEIKCTDGLQCVKETAICNGYVDCADGSDESEDVCKGNSFIILHVFEIT